LQQEKERQQAQEAAQPSSSEPQTGAARKPDSSTYKAEPTTATLDSETDKKSGKLNNPEQ